MTVIDEAKKALEGASPGPWRHAQEVVDPEWSVVTTFGGAVIANINDRADRHPNARFIAWAREGVPALLAEIAAKDAEIARLTAQSSPDVVAQFDSADWYWRTMDPDDCGDSPSEAIQRGMVGCFCVCEIASSFTGPTRYGFIAPVLDPESDDEEFVHFATQQEAMDAAKDRAALARVKGGAA